jgi:hypothetical protein
MVAVTYYGCLSDPPVTEYFPLLNPGYAATAAQKNLFVICNRGGFEIKSFALEDIVSQMNNEKKPCSIEYCKEGPFYRVVKHVW